MKTRFQIVMLLAMPASLRAQVLVDSIPYPGTNQFYWGIHVNADTIFLGADGPGHIYFSDHNGTTLGNQPTGYTFNHGLIKRPVSYLIAQDYTTNGAHLYEVSLGGALMNTWTFPDVLGGHSSGIGDLWADGNAVWYTMYYPDFPNDPYAYAYKWVPGDPTAIDTVPLHGEQPYGIAIKGDTLFYVTDNLNDDQERIYVYDLTNEQDIGWVELPDTPIDNDMSPRGMFYDGEFLYLIANRQGGSAFAYQTVYIYAFDATTGLQHAQDLPNLQLFPNPATDAAWIELPYVRDNRWAIEVIDTQGAVAWQGSSQGGRVRVDVQQWASGSYVIRASRNGRSLSAPLVVERP